MRVLCPKCGHSGYINTNKPLSGVHRHGFYVRHYYAKGLRIHHHIPRNIALALIAVGLVSTRRTEDLH